MKNLSQQDLLLLQRKINEMQRYLTRMAVGKDYADNYDNLKRVWLDDRIEKLLS